MFGKLKVELRHCVIVTIVAVARVCILETRVGEILSAHLVASVGWNHERLHKKVIEEGG